MKTCEKAVDAVICPHCGRELTSMSQTAGFSQRAGYQACTFYGACRVCDAIWEVVVHNDGAGWRMLKYRYMPDNNEEQPWTQVDNPANEPLLCFGPGGYFSRPMSAADLDTACLSILSGLTCWVQTGMVMMGQLTNLIKARRDEHKHG